MYVAANPRTAIAANTPDTLRFRDQRCDLGEAVDEEPTDLANGKDDVDDTI